MIRKVAFLLLLVAFASTLAYGLDASLNYFRAEMSGTDVKLVWDMNNEGDVSRYELQRRFANEPSYRKITSVNPNGSRRYEYTDTELYKTSSGVITIHYKLVVSSNRGDQSYQTSITQTPSAVQRSWGSIKSMFR